MGLPAEAIVTVRSAVSMFQASGFELGAFLAEAVAAWLKASPDKDAATGVENIEDGKERACRKSYSLILSVQSCCGCCP